MSTPIKQGDILAGDIVRRIDQYESSGNGFVLDPGTGDTVTMYELVERPVTLPTAWGTYSDAYNDIWTLDEDGLIRICDHAKPAGHHAPFILLRPVAGVAAEVLAEVDKEMSESGKYWADDLDAVRARYATK